MPELLRWLISQPLVWLILVSWFISRIGGQMQKAARRVAEAQRKAAAGGGSAPAAGGARPSRGPDPEEIAREIRRAMGLEPKPTAAAKPAPARRVQPVPSGIGGAEARRRVDYDEQTLARPAPGSYDDRARRPVVDFDEARPRRGGLREELAEREAKEERTRNKPRDMHLGDGVRDRHLDVHSVAAERARSASSGVSARKDRGEVTRVIETGAAHRNRRLLDLRRPGAAIVAMEVLGPPVSLRPSVLPRDV